MRLVAALFWLIASPVHAQDLPIIAAMAPDGSPARPLYDRLFQNLDEFSGGRLELKYFLNGELGPEGVYFARTRRGQIQLTAVSAYALGAAVPEFALIRAPFLFDSYEEFSFVYAQYLAVYLGELLAEKNLVELRWVGNGWENIYADRPMTRPEMLQGFRLRVPADPNAALIFEALNADVIQVPFTDVIPSLQTGLIKGGESTTLMYVAGRFTDEAKHLTLTRHGFSTGSLVANKTWFDGLSAEDQDIYRRIYIPSDEAYAEIQKVTDDLVAGAIADGVTVHSLSDTDRAAWKAATAGITDALVNRIGGNAERVMDLIEDGKAAFAARANQ